MKIGILGGTFDPIHDGHIAIATLAMEKFQLDRVEFIPCYAPSHRNKPFFNAHDRFEMVKIALKNHPKFHANDCEIKRKEISYTIDTIAELKKQYPHDEFYFIIGSDAFSQLHTWKNSEKLLKWVHFIVVNRHNDLPCENDHIHPLAIEPIAISATAIREKIKKGEKSIDGLDKAIFSHLSQTKRN